MNVPRRVVSEEAPHPHDASILWLCYEFGPRCSPFFRGDAGEKRSDKVHLRSKPVGVAGSGGYFRIRFLVGIKNTDG